MDEAERYLESAFNLAQAHGEAGLADLALAHNVRGGIAFARDDIEGAEA